MTDFSKLSPAHCPKLWDALINKLDKSSIPNTDLCHQQRTCWHALDKEDDKALTDWLMTVFDGAFKDSHTMLVRGQDEPEYIAAKNGKPAQIVFAHGYFSSALHELSHWCIAGKQRRKKDDFGYWYCPDGRDEQHQRQFEQVEIKPQAIECLFSLATNRKFFVSLDNLDADFDASFSTFEQDVYAKALQYLNNPDLLPKDAQRLLLLLLTLCQSNENTVYSPH